MSEREFTIKDSGERANFESGMVRDVTTGKRQWARLFDGPMAKRWAEHLTKGATKYPDVKPGVPNWTLAAGPEELARFKESAVRHFVQWFLGETDEDHASATFFNINGAEYVKERLEQAAERNTVAQATLSPEQYVKWRGGVQSEIAVKRALHVAELERFDDARGNRK